MFASDKYLQFRILATWSCFNITSMTEMIWSWAVYFWSMFNPRVLSFVVLTQSEGGSPEKPTYAGRPWLPIHVFLMLLRFSAMASSSANVLPGEKLFQMPGLPPGLPFSLGSWPSKSSLSCQKSDALKQVF